MKIPKRLKPLIEDGVITAVVSRLMSGKEADVYIVKCGSELRCAKIYKDAVKRSFKQAVHYREGRKVRNSRRGRAMEKGSRYGRQQQEETWQTAEVDALYKLKNAGVCVPEAYGCVDGVLLMELITDSDGDVAPKLSDVTMTAVEARRDYLLMINAVVRMLIAGIVHGDLSEFNVLVGEAGPVIIDLPQAVDAATNNHAETMFARDVNNLTRYYGQYAPELLETHYAKEIWSLYSEGELHEGVVLTGLFEENSEAPDVDGMLKEISAVLVEEEARQERLQEAEQAS